MKTKRRIFAIAAAFAFIVGVLSPVKVFADSQITLNIGFQNTSDADEGKVLYSVDGGENWNQAAAGDTSITVPDGNQLQVRIVPNDGYNIDWTATSYRTDGGDPVSLQNDNTGIAGGLAGANGYYINPADVTTVELAGVEFAEGGAPGPGPAPGNTTARITVTAPAGSWRGKPMVREQEFPYEADEETVNTDYDKYCGVVGVGLNMNNPYEGQMTRRGSRYGETVEATQDITYNREDGDTTVNVSFYHGSWGDRIDSLKINGTDYTEAACIDLDGNPDTNDKVSLETLYNDRFTWLNHFLDQGVFFVVEGVPVSATEEYEIEVKVRPITEEECFIGNFLWSNDDYFAPEEEGGIEPNDLYIGHSNLTLISVDFNDGDPNYDFNANGGFKHLDINATEGEEEVYPYVHYQLDRMGTAASSTEVATSEMVIPEGAWVTMKIEPHYGYQVKSFSGVGQDDIDLGGTSVFSFKVGKGNFHIGAQVEEQEDEVKVASDAIAGGEVELAEGTLETGSARLQVEDANVSAAKETAFESEAEDSGYEIDSYLGISLDQVFYKGTGNSDDVWANSMEDLENAATISLTLDGDLDGDDVAIIHNIHNGDEFEVIDAEYDADTKTITFPTNSFSDFAIATKAASTSEDTTDTSTTETTTTEATTEAPSTEDSSYTITAGDGSTHTADDSGNITITCNGPLEDLVSISVDGKVIDSSNYTLESGSTILTLKASYLNTLSAGNHTVTFTYKNGKTATATITIKEAAKTSPKTGDAVPIAAVIVFAILGAAGMIYIGSKKRMM